MRRQLSAAAHELLPHANPLSSGQMSELAADAAAASPATALDIGCGPGSFSIDLASRVPVSIRAIDLNSVFLARARKDAQESKLLGRIEFLERPFKPDEAGRHDLVVCIGSSGAIGRPDEALHHCKDLLAPSGTLIFADLVWAGSPPADFLSFLGVDESAYWAQTEGGAVFARHGLRVSKQLLASAASWQAYEEAVLAGRLRFAQGLKVEEAEKVRTRAEAWFSRYKLQGRSCLGFVAYIARRTED